MTSSRVGFGFDVHPFLTGETGGRRLLLGGVEFPGETPLAGHSDADVIAHAIGDALLGAAGLGDLGMHFPDTDPAWHGANSIGILRGCLDLVEAAGFHLVNADCTVICERPKIAPQREAMIELLSVALAAPVHVKATRPEGLGSLGRVEGIACMAVVLVES
jgi:2-C-methyl-D-erythritol 2,4-cyclodiphosphate synthase